MKRRHNLAAALGVWSARHRKTAVFGWVLFVVIATVVGGAAGQRQLTEAQEGAGSSAQALSMLDAAHIAEPAGEMVIIHSGSASATAPAFRASVQAVEAAVQHTGLVDDLRDPYAAGLISADKHSALVTFDMKGDPDTAADRVQPVLDAVTGVRAGHPDVTINEFGDASAQQWFNQTLGKDFKRAEWTAVPLALGILLVAFGALLAAIVPVLLALTAFAAALGLLALASQSSPVDASSSSVMLLMGLAVGVDYCLFYLRREREERRAGRDPETALRVAAATSGRSVLVSGLTVTVAMAGMFLSGLRIFEGFALATILVVAVAVLGSVTVLPALLSMLGDRVELGRVPFMRRGVRPARRRGRGRGVRAARGSGAAVLETRLTGTRLAETRLTETQIAETRRGPAQGAGRAADTDAYAYAAGAGSAGTVSSGAGSSVADDGTDAGGRIWRATLGRVAARPALCAVLSAGFLLVLAIPALGLHTEKLSIDQQLPQGAPLVQTYDQISAAFPGGPAPAVVVVKDSAITGPAARAAIAAFEQAALRTGVLGDPAHGEPIRVIVTASAGIAQIQVPLAGDGAGAVSQHALSVLRDQVVPQTLDRLPGAQVAVGGELAFGVDFNAQLRQSIPLVFGFVLAVTLLLMLVAFRSPVVAVTAVVLNLLSIGAAYGVMVAIFQHGWGASLVDTHAPGAIESWLPLFVFVVLFGLSMDYHVFVVSRIKEARDRGMPTKRAVMHGLHSAAGTVTSAAVIMVAVFGVFGTLSMQDFKQLGVGLAVAVALDATVIRVLLLPSVMILLGERNWYLPRWMAHLPGLRGAGHGEGSGWVEEPETALGGAAPSGPGSPADLAGVSGISRD